MRNLTPDEREGINAFFWSHFPKADKPAEILRGGRSEARLRFSSGSSSRLYSSTEGLKWKSGSSATMSFHSGVRHPCLRIQVHSVI